MSTDTTDTDTKVTTPEITLENPSTVFRLKPEATPGELTLDQAMEALADVYRKFAPLKARLENLKEVAKAGLKAKGETSYTNAAGVKVCFRSKQASKVNKALAKEICGPRWAEVEKFVTETSFHVIVPGVKSPDAE